MVVGRYVLHDVIARGGMAAVHLGRLVGPAGFSRIVAIKRMHPHIASDPEFVAMFLDEARLAARIRHPNVVPTLDVLAEGGEAFLVMDYVAGEALSRVMRELGARKERVPPRIASAIMIAALEGLHAAHDATGESGEPLGLVHRDVSPQNLLLGTDGIVRVIDFGVAKAAGRVQTTRQGQLKGKMAYMAPEQLRGQAATRLSDIYAAGVVFWELLTGERLFKGENDAQIMAMVLKGPMGRPSMRSEGLERTIHPSSMRSLEALDDVVMRALAEDPSARFPTAREMAVAIARGVPAASPGEVAALLSDTVPETLARRASLVAVVEKSGSSRTDSRATLASPIPVLDVAVEVIADVDPNTSYPVESSVSLAVPKGVFRTLPPARRSRLVWISMGAGAVALAIATLFLVRRAGPLPASIAKPTSSGSAAGPPTSAAMTTMASQGATAPALVASGSAPAPIPLAPLAAVPLASGSSGSRAAVVPLHPGPSSRPAPAAAGKPRPTVACDPPYFFDATGNKVFKEECL
jgi:serine/threonine-protein kinase